MNKLKLDIKVLLLRMKIFSHWKILESFVADEAPNTYETQQNHTKSWCKSVKGDYVSDQQQVIES